MSNLIFSFGCLLGLIVLVYWLAPASPVSSRDRRPNDLWWDWWMWDEDFNND